MTRFEKELSGTLGAGWKASAERELEKVRKEFEEGKITVDGNGVARNRIGRILMDDMLEKLTYITDTVDEEATKAARAEEVSRSLEAYRRSYKGPTEEEKAEMRTTFGIGSTVVDIITGEQIRL